MIKNALIFLVIFSFASIGCNQITNGKNESDISNDPAIDIAPIVQIADTINGVKGKSVVFHLSEYFVSDSPFESVWFFSKDVTIEPMEEDSFKISQPENFVGKYNIQGVLNNYDQQNLEATLTYAVTTIDSSVTDTAATNEPEHSTINQIATHIDGKQGEETTFSLSDYFQSKASIQQVDFSAVNVAVEHLQGDSYRISQPENVSGEEIIAVYLVNDEDQKLNAEIIYTITPTEPEPSPITQIASEIEGTQGKETTFSLFDYFQSEASIQQVDFSAVNVTVEHIQNESYRISQPENVTGEQTIDVFLKNSDSQELSAKIMYTITAADNPPPPNPDNETLVIMPLGDSMTNDSRPRVAFWNLLEADGYSLDYVGNQKQDSSIPDADHEGVGGIKIQEIADKTAALMNTHQPNYILLMVGTNDIAWYFNETGSQIAKRWNNLIQLIFDSSDSDTYIIAATIPPMSSKNVGSSSMDIKDRALLIQKYNQALRSYVAERKANGDNIILADMYAELNPSLHLSSDGVHLNSQGYSIMGETYYKAMLKVLTIQQ